MTTIRIRQCEASGGALNATVSFDGGEQVAVRVTDPFALSR